MPLLIDVEESRQVLTMEDCLSVIEEAYVALGNDEALNIPKGGRTDVWTPLPESRGKTLFPDMFYCFATLQGVIRPKGVFALRIRSEMTYFPKDSAGQRFLYYCIEPGKYCGLVFLFSIWSGEWLAILHDGWLHRMRVGATAGLGAKFLARQNAETVGVLGSGGMARTYLEAFTKVRPIRRAKVFSPNREHREAYAREMSEKLAIDVRPVGTAEEAVRDVDILASCTDSARAIIDPAWLKEGIHITPVVTPEMPEEAVRKVDVLVRHLDGGAEGYFLGRPEELGPVPDETLKGMYRGTDRLKTPTLADLLTGKTPGRTNDKQVTCYFSVPGSGIQFAAVGLKVYELAKQRGLGKELPLEWFLETERS